MDRATRELSQEMESLTINTAGEMTHVEENALNFNFNSLRINNSNGSPAVFAAAPGSSSEAQAQSGSSTRTSTPVPHAGRSTPTSTNTTSTDTGTRASRSPVFERPDNLNLPRTAYAGSRERALYRQKIKEYHAKRKLLIELRRAKAPKDLMDRAMKACREANLEAFHASRALHRVEQKAKNPEPVGETEVKDVGEALLNLSFMADAPKEDSMDTKE